jgi:hypothetical protein
MAQTSYERITTAYTLDRAGLGILGKFVLSFISKFFERFSWPSARPVSNALAGTQIQYGGHGEKEQ